MADPFFISTGGIDHKYETVNIVSAYGACNEAPRAIVDRITTHGYHVRIRRERRSRGRRSDWLFSRISFASLRSGEIGIETITPAAEVTR